MTEHLWETLDNLFKTTHRHSRRVEQLEARIADLERRLSEQGDSSRSTAQVVARVGEFHAERAA